MNILEIKSQHQKLVDKTLCSKVYLSMFYLLILTVWYLTLQKSFHINDIIKIAARIAEIIVCLNFSVIP